METPLFNLAIFFVIVVISAALFWPRLGIVPAVRGRLRMTKRTQLEDALKFIYNSTHTGDSATTFALSRALNISSSQGSELGAHMSRAGLVNISDGHILLTAEGEQSALQIIRAHRIWERYLAEETSLKPKEWHTSAEEYEHRISPEEVNSLADRLGNPLFDPHGDPIPTAEGEYQDRELINLTELPVGTCARVMHMEDEPENIFDRLVALNIYIGMEFTLKSVSDGSYVLEADNRTLEISPDEAPNLSIEQIDMIDKSNAGCARESLDTLKVGESAKIVQINPMCRGFERRRLLDLGIVPNTTIEYYKNGLTGGLKAFSVRGTVLALRNEQIRMISISGRKRDKS